MNKLEIEKRLEELKNVHYVNIHHKNGFIYSSHPTHIINSPEQNYLRMQLYKLNIKYDDITTIDSYY